MNFDKKDRMAWYRTGILCLKIQEKLEKEGLSSGHDFEVPQDLWNVKTSTLPYLDLILIPT